MKTNTILYLIIILLTISFSLNTTEEYTRYKCGRTSITCNKTDTCCRSKEGSGWKCFPSKDAVCCSDGLSACPKGTKCNLPKKSCDPVAFLFLEKNYENEEY